MQLYATLHGPLMRLPALPGQLRAAFPPQPGGRPWAHDITTLAAVEKKAGVVVLVFTVDPAFAHFCYVGLRLPPSRRGAVYGVTELQQLLGGMAAVFQNQPMVYEQWEGGAESALPEHAAPRNVLFYRPLTAESDLYSVATASAGRLLRDEPAALQAAYTALEDVWAAMADESPASQAEEDASVGLPSLAMTGDSAFAPAQPTAPARKPNLLHVTYSDKPTARLAMETSGSGGVTNPLVGTLLDGTSPVEPFDGGRVHLDAGSAVPQPVDAAGRHVYHSFYLASNVTNLNTARPVQYRWTRRHGQRSCAPSRRPPTPPRGVRTALRWRQALQLPWVPCRALHGQSTFTAAAHRSFFAPHRSASPRLQGTRTIPARRACRQW
jgi:hypothetical protein